VTYDRRDVLLIRRRGGRSRAFLTFGPVDVQVQAVLGRPDLAAGRVGDVGEQLVDGMPAGGRTLDAGGRVDGPVAQPVPRGRRVDVGRREPQVAQRRPRVRHAQVRPGAGADLDERHLDAGHGALSADVHGGRFAVTAATAVAGPLSRRRRRRRRRGHQQQQRRAREPRPAARRWCGRSPGHERNVNVPVSD